MRSPGRAFDRYESCHVRSSSRLSVRYVAPRLAASAASNSRPPVAEESAFSGCLSAFVPAAIEYTTTFAFCAAAIA